MNDISFNIHKGEAISIIGKSGIGKSVLFVVSNSEKVSKACSGIPGVDTCASKNLSVLNLAPGGTIIRLTVFSKKAIEEISQIQSTHLELMVTLQ